MWADPALAAVCKVLQEENDNSAVVAQLLLLFHVRSQGGLAIPKANSSPVIVSATAVAHMLSNDVVISVIRHAILLT